MANYKCKNLGSCDKADTGEIFEFSVGATERCPGCGLTLTNVSALARTSETGGNRMPMIVGGVVAIIVIAAAIFLVPGLRGGKTVLKAEDSPPAAAPAEAPAPKSETAPASPAPATSPTPANEAAAVAVNEAMPAPMLAREEAARKTCEEATLTKAANAQDLCKRASAVTLMNSGVLAAIAGRIDEAERDYLAAKEKDPSFPELYFNLAVLKARQGKGAESLDHLTLAEAKGFKQFSAIAQEPALQKLKADPALKAKIEMFERKP